MNLNNKAGTALLPLAKAGTALLPLAKAGTALLPLAKAGTALLPLDKAGTALLPLAKAGPALLPLAKAGTALLPLDKAGTALLPLAKAGTALLPLAKAGTCYPGKSIYEDERLKTYQGENRIPHWELDSVIYHVCFRLNDSVPREKQDAWRREREAIQEQARMMHRDLTENEKKRQQYLYSDKIEQYLDSGYGECLLKNPAVAEIVKQSLEFYDGVKYELHCWSIMPNHVHIAFKLLGNADLSKVLHGWRSYTAHAINKLLGRSGILWQPDCYNHIIRSEAECKQQMRYIWENPEKAGYQNWPWRGCSKGVPPLSCDAV